MFVFVKGCFCYYTHTHTYIHTPNICTVYTVAYTFIPRHIEIETQAKKQKKHRNTIEFEIHLPIMPARTKQPPNTPASSVV